MRVALAAEASDAVSEVFSASPRSAQVAAGFLRALASPPEWLLDEALSHKGSVDVVEALLDRVDVLDFDKIRPALKVRKSPVAQAVAASPIISRFSRSELKGFAYSVHPRVRAVFAANPAAPSDLVVAALLGRKADDSPLLRLRGLPKDLVDAALSRLSHAELEQLTASLFPQVLDRLLRRGQLGPVDPTRVLESALVGLEVCRDRRRLSDLPAMRDYLQLFRKGLYLQHSPSSAVLEAARLVNGIQNFGPALASFDFDEVRRLLRAASLSGPLSRHFDSRNIDRLRAAVLFRTSVDEAEAREVLDFLVSLLSPSNPSIYVHRVVMTPILSRIFDLLPPADVVSTFEYLAEVLPSDVGAAPPPRTDWPSPRLIELVPVETAARVFRLAQLLAWPTDQVVAWLASRGVGLAEMLALDETLAASHPAADLAAILSPSPTPHSQPA